MLAELIETGAHQRNQQFAPCEFRVKWVTLPWEAEHAYRLRRAVFCIEQGIFVGDDRDAVDSHARLLVAQSYVGGMPEQVVGTVRIHEAEPGVWWGSRLAVHAAFRRHGRLGASLIRLAVSSAHQLGCKRFLAHVQEANAGLFEKLGWGSLQQENLHGRPHRLMQADLLRYPACATPGSGYVIQVAQDPA